MKISRKNEDFEKGFKSLRILFVLWSYFEVTVLEDWLKMYLCAKWAIGTFLTKYDVTNKALIRPNILYCTKTNKMREKYSNVDYFCPAFFDNVCLRNVRSKLTEIFCYKIFPFFFFFFFSLFLFLFFPKLSFSPPRFITILGIPWNRSQTYLV